MKHLALRIDLAKFARRYFFDVNGVFIVISWERDVETGENKWQVFKTNN